MMFRRWFRRRKTILDEAKAGCFGARGRDYGHPRENFARIAALWNAYLDGRPNPGPITVADVALMSALIKVARLIETPEHRDGWVDLAGYAECGARVTGVDE